MHKTDREVEKLMKEAREKYLDLFEQLKNCTMKLVLKKVTLTMILILINKITKK